MTAHPKVGQASCLAKSKQKATKVTKPLFSSFPFVKNAKAHCSKTCSLVSFHRARLSALLLLSGSVLCVLIAAAADNPRILDGRSYHLGTAGSPEWDYFEGKTPHNRGLEVRFSAQPNEREATLFVYQDDVKLDWGVALNGKRVGSLVLMEAPLINAVRIPAGALRSGENILAILPPKAIDDIIVGEFELDLRPGREAIEQSWLEIQVTGDSRREELPCRLTIVRETGELVPLSAGEEHRLAVRPGVVYTPDGKARVGTRPGPITIYATRGFEYSLATTNLILAARETRRVELQLRREVPTPGLVSSDTHIHTFTHSQHGDATLDERAITLAGEGIELPIATDHESLTDFAEPARRMAVEKFFTPVIGCETTTAKGHFNHFPITAGSKAPDARIVEWPRLMEAIRSTPGVHVVILNHPRNVHSNFQPFAATNFNAVTGENKRGFEFSFDAIEVCNSSALQSDLMLGFHDWLALLNYGHRVAAVGSSDGHDVSRYIVGQGRSYVACEDREPGRIDVGVACESFLKGRVLVSLGLLAQMKVDREFGVGDLATGLGRRIRVEATVLGPSWVTADRVELYANGVKIREQKIDPVTDTLSPSEGQRDGVRGRVRGEKSGKGASDLRKTSAGLAVRPADGIKTSVTWLIPRPRHDVHLVAIASGPGVRAPYWGIARPYQPSSRVWNPRVIGATNPIWIDADGDGKFSSARTYAQTLVRRHGTGARGLLRALAPYDEAVAAQAACLIQKAGADLHSSEFTRQLKAAPAPVRRGFEAFLQAERRAAPR